MCGTIWAVSPTMNERAFISRFESVCPVWATRASADWKIHAASKWLVWHVGVPRDLHQKNDRGNMQVDSVIGGRVGGWQRDKSKKTHQHNFESAQRKVGWRYWKQREKLSARWERAGMNFDLERESLQAPPAKPAAASLAPRPVMTKQSAPKVAAVTAVSLKRYAMTFLKFSACHSKEGIWKSDDLHDSSSAGCAIFSSFYPESAPVDSRWIGNNASVAFWAFESWESWYFITVMSLFLFQDWHSITANTSSSFESW